MSQILKDIHDKAKAIVIVKHEPDLDRLPYSITINADGGIYCWVTYRDTPLGDSDESYYISDNDLNTPIEKHIEEVKRISEIRKAEKEARDLKDVEARLLREKKRLAGNEAIGASMNGKKFKALKTPSDIAIGAGDEIEIVNIYDASIGVYLCKVVSAKSCMIGTEWYIRPFNEKQWKEISEAN